MGYSMDRTIVISGVCGTLINDKMEKMIPSCVRYA